MSIRSARANSLVGPSIPRIGGASLAGGSLNSQGRGATSRAVGTARSLPLIHPVVSDAASAAESRRGPPLPRSASGGTRGGGQNGGDDDLFSLGNTTIATVEEHGASLVISRTGAGRQRSMNAAGSVRSRRGGPPVPGAKAASAPGRFRMYVGAASASALRGGGAVSAPARTGAKKAPKPAPTTTFAGAIPKHIGVSNRLISLFDRSTDRDEMLKLPMRLE